MTKNKMLLNEHAHNYIKSHPDYPLGLEKDFYYLFANNQQGETLKEDFLYLTSAIEAISFSTGINYSLNRMLDFCDKKQKPYYLEKMGLEFTAGYEACIRELEGYYQKLKEKLNTYL